MVNLKGVNTFDFQCFKISFLKIYTYILTFLHEYFLTVFQ